MSKIYAIDIETCCNVSECEGFGVWHKCNHALDAHRGRITQIGVWNPDTALVFKNLEDFDRWLLTDDSENFLFIGQNFKFDLKFLNNAGFTGLVNTWVGDTQLLASLYSPKIPDEWLAEYEVKRQTFIEQVGKDNAYMFRKGSKHSLKTLAPYYLGVEPFWEALGTEDEEYVLKDCEYTYRLYEFFLSRLKSFDPYNFYETYMFPAEKFLLGVELRGMTIDLPQLELDKAAALKEIKQIEHKLSDIWIDAFGKWEEEQKEKIRDKYEKMLQTAKDKVLGKKKVSRSKKIISYAKDIISSHAQLLRRLND